MVGLIVVGLEIYDRFGNRKVGVGDRLMRFLGYVIATSPTGSVTHDGLLTGVPFAVSAMFSNNGSTFWAGEGILRPTINFSGNTMSWSYDPSLPTKIIQFGVR